MRFDFMVRRRGNEAGGGTLVFWADAEWVVFGDPEGSGFLRARWDELEFAGFIVPRSPFESFIRPAEGAH